MHEVLFAHNLVQSAKRSEHSVWDHSQSTEVHMDIFFSLVSRLELSGVIGYVRARFTSLKIQIMYRCIREVDPVTRGAVNKKTKIKPTIMLLFGCSV